MDPSTRYTPEATPAALRALLCLLGLGGICTGLFFNKAVSALGLSYAGIAQGKFWQLATYPFILAGPLSWWTLLILALEILFIWIYSAAIIEQKGIKSFFFLSFGAIAAAGLATLALQSSSILIGMAPLLLAVMAAWLLLNPGASLLILGFSVKAALLIGAFIAFDLLIHFSQQDWVSLTANASASLFGLAYCKIPLAARRRSKALRQAKIYDIRSGKPVLDDEKFMDAMLARISRHGEHSLSSDEKKRMQQISEKTRKDTP